MFRNYQYFCTDMLRLFKSGPSLRPLVILYYEPMRLTTPKHPEKEYSIRFCHLANINVTGSIQYRHLVVVNIITP